MARSASVATRVSLLVLGAAAVGALTGCVTTQRKSARAALVAERTLAGRKRVRVTVPDRSVRVTGMTRVAGHGGGALVVRLRNVGSRPLTDLPISVGTMGDRRRRTYLNATPGLGYFQTHVAAIGAHSTGTWLFIDRRHPIPRGKPFAIVGHAGSPPSTTESTLPELSATDLGARGPILRMSVVNRSGVPQYGLPVYAVATRHGRAVAAGRATIAHLGMLGRTNLELRLVGDPSGAAVRTFALPTIFE